MVYANIEYLSKNGEWLAFASYASLSAELLVLAIAGLVNSWGSTTTWRVRVRH